MPILVSSQNIFKNFKSKISVAPLKKFKILNFLCLRNILRRLLVFFSTGSDVNSQEPRNIHLFTLPSLTQSCLCLLVSKLNHQLLVFLLMLRQRFIPVHINLKQVNMVGCSQCYFLMFFVFPLKNI